MAKSLGHYGVRPSLRRYGARPPPSPRQAGIVKCTNEDPPVPRTVLQEIVTALTALELLFGG